jgi:hypothetical protein
LKAHTSTAGSIFATFFPESRDDRLALMAYIASPFVTAWSIREVACTGDIDYLARAID